MAAYIKNAKLNGYSGPDAFKNWYVAHDRLFAKLQFSKNLMKCPAPGCTFEPSGGGSVNSKVKRHLKGV